MRAFALFSIVVVIAVTAGCLEPPGVGRAADPSKADGPAPWGSATSNEEMEKKVKLLEDILDGKVLAADLPKRVEKDWPTYQRQAIDFHLRYARAWGNRSGRDLADQVDPEFIPGQVPLFA